MSMNGCAFAMADMKPYNRISKTFPLPSSKTAQITLPPPATPLVAASGGNGLPFVGIVGDNENRFGVFYIHTLALGMFGAARPQAYELTLGIITRVASDEIIVAKVDGVCIAMIAVGILPGNTARGHKPAHMVAAAGDVPSRAASVALTVLRDMCTAYLGSYITSAEARLRKLASQVFGHIDAADRIAPPFPDISSVLAIACADDSAYPVQIYWPLLFACYFGHRAVQVTKKAVAAGKCTAACAQCASLLAARIARIAGPAQFYTLSGFMYPLQASVNVQAQSPPFTLSELSVKEHLLLGLCALDAELAYILQMGHGVRAPQWSTIVPAELWDRMLPGIEGERAREGPKSPFGRLRHAHDLFLEAGDVNLDDLRVLALDAIESCYEQYRYGRLENATWDLDPLVAAYKAALSLNRGFDITNIDDDIALVANKDLFCSQEVARLRFITYDARGDSDEPAFEGIAHMQASYPYNYPVLALGPARLCRSSCLHTLKDLAVDKWKNDTNAANTSGLAVHPGTAVAAGDELTVWYHCHYRGNHNENCNCKERCADPCIVGDELKNAFESSM